MVLSAIGAQQSSATEETLKEINQILDYFATYPDDVIVYRSSDMTLTANSDAIFNNETKAIIIAGAHILPSENEPIPRWNGTILTIEQMIKYVLSLAAEAEMGALFLTEKNWYQQYPH